MQNIELTPSYILNRDLILNRMKRYGIRSLGALADLVGVHRNTIQHFMGGQPVFPESIARMIALLELTPAQALILKEDHNDPVWKRISGVVSTLYETFPGVTFVLFGSRAKGEARRYSDFDLGLFSKKGISTKDYLKIVERVEELGEDLPFRIDLVNLTVAEDSFIRSISPAAVFLAGNRLAWESFRTELNEKNDRKIAAAEV